MKNNNIYTLAGFLFLLLMMVSVRAEESADVIVTKPPASIAKWYKPANKRQVWLHTMFNLRREMQAIGEYSALEDKARLQHWVKKFAEDYKSIGKMVPEWADELEVEHLDKMARTADKGDYTGVIAAQQKVGQSCSGCHKEFRAVTAALYRGPDFSKVMVEDSETMESREFKEAMQGISSTVNRVKIALDDNRLEDAAAAQKQIVHRLGDIAESCSACHKTDRQRDYLLGKENMSHVENLGKFIEMRDVKQGQHALGNIAVNICATCHSIHRTLADLRGFIDKH